MSDPTAGAGEHLLWCPFCRSPKIELIEVDAGDWAVDCEDCRCIGPIVENDPDGAVAAWNAAPRRPDIVWRPMTDKPRGQASAMIRSTGEDGAYLLPGPVHWNRGTQAWVDEVTGLPLRLAHEGDTLEWAHEHELTGAQS